MRPDTASFVAVASEAVVQAGDAIAPYFGLPADRLQAEFKGDETPVTKADHESERIISAALLDAFDDVALIREEAENTGNCSEGTICLIDPLDGTSSFFRGIPTYAILAALAERQGEKSQVTACIVYEPQTGRQWSAIKGGGAFLSTRTPGSQAFGEKHRVQVSDRGLFPADKAMVIYDAALRFRDVVPTVENKASALSGVLPLFRLGRMIGSLALQCAYVSSGFAEATVIDAVGGPYDLCAHLLVDEAGGQSSDLGGEPIDIFRTKLAIATNGDRHMELVEKVSDAYSAFSAYA